MRSMFLTALLLTSGLLGASWDAQALEPTPRRTFSQATRDQAAFARVRSWIERLRGALSGVRQNACRTPTLTSMVRNCQANRQQLQVLRDNGPVFNTAEIVELRENIRELRGWLTPNFIERNVCTEITLEITSCFDGLEQDLRALEAPPAVS